MATRTYTEYVDDLTGIAADDVQPVEFSFEGKAYVIDLSDEHRDDFRAHLSVFIAKARPLTKASSRPRAATGGASRNDLPAIRAWAQLLGHNVRQRGRIPAEIIAAYDAAH